MGFASSQPDGDKAPFNICKCVNLRVAPSARTANSLLLLPPFPPAADVYYAADNTAIIDPIDAPDVRRAADSSLSQNRFLRTIPIPLQKTNQDRIVRTKKLMSSHPSLIGLGKGSLQLCLLGHCRPHTHFAKIAQIRRPLGCGRRCRNASHLFVFFRSFWARLLMRMRLQHLK